MDMGAVVETGQPEAFFSAPTTDRARQFLLRYSGTSIPSSSVRSPVMGSMAA